jgi:hypothetical protein
MRFHRPDGREEPDNRVISKGGEVFDINSGPAEAIKGIVEDVKARPKK